MAVPLVLKYMHIYIYMQIYATLQTENNWTNMYTYIFFILNITGYIYIKNFKDEQERQFHKTLPERHHKCYLLLLNCIKKERFCHQNHFQHWKISCISIIGYFISAVSFNNKCLPKQMSSNKCLNLTINESHSWDFMLLATSYVPLAIKKPPLKWWRLPFKQNHIVSNWMKICLNLNLLLLKLNGIRLH